MLECVTSSLRLISTVLQLFFCSRVDLLLLFVINVSKVPKQICDTTRCPLPVAGSEPHEWVLVVETKQKPFPEWLVTASVSATKAVYRNQNTGTNRGSDVTITLSLLSICSSWHMNRWLHGNAPVQSDIFHSMFHPSPILAAVTTVDRFRQAWWLSCLHRWNSQLWS